MREPNRRRAALLVALASVAHASIARADPPAAAPVALAWVRAEGAESCPDGDAIARAVASRLGRDPFQPAAAQHVEAVVARDGTRWTARIFVRDATGAVIGVRQIAGDAPDCVPIATAAVVALAVAIDPESAFAAPPSPPSPRPPARPLPTPSPVRAAPVRRVSRASTLRLARGVSAVARSYGALGLLPALAPGAGLAVDPWVSGRVRLAIQALFLGEQATAAPRIGLGLSAAAAGLCVDVVSTRAVALAACGAVWLGAMYAVVYQLTPVEPGPRPWLAGSLGARFTVRILGPISAEIALDAVAPFTDYRYFVEGSSTTLFQAPRVAALGSLGVGVRFW